jgi:hypothetical protein
MKLSSKLWLEMKVFWTGLTRLASFGARRMDRTLVKILAMRCIILIGQ